MDLHRSSGRSNGSSGSHGSTNDIWTEGLSSLVNGLDWRASQDDRSLAFDDAREGDADEEADEDGAGENDDEGGSGLDCFAYF